MKKLVLSLYAIAGVLMASADARPDLVAQVRAGTCTEARASWWGFDPADSTAPGFYRMSVDVGRVAFCLTEADAPVAIDATAHTQGFIYSVGSFWLAVPPKTEKFALYASGAGEERVHVTLTDPQGICVWDYHNISGWERVVVSGNPPPGLWKVTMKKPSQGHFEDARFDVAGIPGFLFLTPEKTWAAFPVRPATHACR